MANIWPALKQSYLFWVGAGLAACSLIIGLLGLSYKHLDERFASEGVPADGQVLTKKKEENPDRDSRYLVEYGFVDTQGKAVRAWDALPKEVWDGLNIGQKTPIAFLRSEPAKVRLTSPLIKQDGKPQLWFAACAGVLAIVSLSAAFVRLSNSGGL